MCPRCTRLHHAEFDSYVTHLNGEVRFANQERTGNRHRDRVYPVLSRSKRHRQRREPLYGVCVEKVSRSIERASYIAAARRWLPCNPLTAHAMRVEDAISQRWAT